MFDSGGVTARLLLPRVIKYCKLASVAGANWLMALSVTVSLRFPGRVRAAQRADLTFNVPGQVIELPVEEGQLINKGDLVARLDDANYKIQMRSALAKQ